MPRQQLSATGRGLEFVALDDYAGTLSGAMPKSFLNPAALQQEITVRQEIGWPKPFAPFAKVGILYR
jgi:hypothetical protein